MIMSGSLPLLAPCRATRFRPEVPLVGGWALPEQSHPCKTEGGRPASVDHTPARTGPLPIHPLKTLEAHCVVHISEFPVGQWAMCTQNPGRKGQVRGLTETCSKALSSFYQKPCWVLSRDR